MSEIGSVRAILSEVAGVRQKHFPPDFVSQNGEIGLLGEVPSPSARARWVGENRGTTKDVPAGMTISRRAALLICSIVITGSCSAVPSSNHQRRSGVEDDCLVPIVYAGHGYMSVWSGRRVPVRADRFVGSARYAYCDDEGGSTTDGEIHDVYASPGVPVEQAVVVRGPHRQRGWLHVRSEAPATPWDPDLVAPMDEWSAELPGS